MSKMTTEEAFIKVLQMHGIEHAFGIIGSAFMPISDLGGTPCVISMVIAQNGPGITGLVTPIKTAYWNHTPLLLVSPQAANKTMGQGGFQEVEQMNLFKDMVCYQEEVRDPRSNKNNRNPSRVIFIRSVNLIIGYGAESGT